MVKLINWMRHAALASVCGFVVVQAHAALGENIGSTLTNSSAPTELTRIREQTDKPFRVVETTEQGSGLTTRQYVDLSGNVFGVAWSGSHMPNLEKLLGQSFDRLIKHQQGVAHAGHPFVVMHDDDLVIESAGHMGAFAGRAYLAHNFPAGVGPADVQ